MANEMMRPIEGGAPQIPREHLELAKRQLLPEGSTDEELQWFAAWCRARGLDPVTGDVWAMREKKTGKLVMQATIQGKRAIAELAGGVQSTRVEWSANGADWFCAWTFDDKPMAARAIVTTMDGRLFEGVAIWRERARSGFAWESMPAHMLGKVAESDALSRAFPRVLGQVYTPDEFDEDPRPKDPRPKPAAPMKQLAEWSDADQKKALDWRSKANEARTQVGLPPLPQADHKEAWTRLRKQHEAQMNDIGRD